MNDRGALVVVPNTNPVLFLSASELTEEISASNHWGQDYIGTYQLDQVRS